LCLRCLDKDPARRLASAGELADELQRWLNGEPILARRITVRERLGKWTRRHPYRAVALGVFALVVVGAGVAITWQWRRAAANERRALASAAAERRISYSATLAQALAAREHHDFGQARRLLNGIAPELRAFDWKLIQGLCRGDEVAAWRLGESPGDEPQCLTLLPDRHRLAILSADGRLHLHDLDGNRTEPPRELPPLPEGSGQVRHYRGLTFSPDGTRLAYACGDVLQVLEARSLTVLHQEISRQPQCGWLDNDRLLYGFNGSVASPPWPNAGVWILDFRDVQTGGGQIRPHRLSRDVCAARGRPGSAVLRPASRHCRSRLLGTHPARVPHRGRLRPNPSAGLHPAGTGVPRPPDDFGRGQVPRLLCGNVAAQDRARAGDRHGPGPAGNHVSIPHPRPRHRSAGTPPGSRGRRQCGAALRFHAG
jgi:hypothetical protein